ncbi:hypothetical protein MNBD_PLANCTO02-833 [hydrothermal vent metagenome]|uniref:Uncharacterized protein n=1 Tax=hydrothermal vent metagenome TaxID=652676 RepID=A0A3B1DTI3_9ZZZZ
MKVTRRQALKSITTTAAAFATLPSSNISAASKPEPHRTRGVVLRPFDLSLKDWPERCVKAGINTIGLHANRRVDVLVDFVSGEEGKRFLSRCAKLNIEVEYELHIMGDLLSREYFSHDQSLFRMHKIGRRTPDGNCNPFSSKALDIIAKKAVDYARILKPTTNRYFFWPDDGGKWDFSPQARNFNASDQSLLVENRIIKALRKHVNPKAELAHLSYHNTLSAPSRVKPEPGIFLEFAPITRDYNKSIIERNAKTLSPSKNHPDPQTNAGYLDYLTENLKLFGVKNAQILEYWLDASLFTRNARRIRKPGQKIPPVVKVPWDEKVCRSDVAAYRELGIKHFTTFACLIDARYEKLYGDPQPILDAYGKALS